MYNGPIVLLKLCRTQYIYINPDQCVAFPFVSGQRPRNNYYDQLFSFRRRTVRNTQFVNAIKGGGLVVAKQYNNSGRGKRRRRKWQLCILFLSSTSTHTPCLHCLHQVQCSWQQSSCRQIIEAPLKVVAAIRAVSSFCAGWPPDQLPQCFIPLKLQHCILEQE